MSLKDVLKKDFGNFEKIILKRFKSSKFIFIVMGFLFFLDFFLSSYFIKTEFFLLVLPFLYICFIISLLLLTYYSIKIKFKEKINLVFSIILTIILIIIGAILSIPFLLDSKTLSNLI